ncbi:helix-turn-helix domain-containing protein [Aquirhabdus parva]|uniref:DNA-binding protein n=1 Tax=Aquirhabdus parva TaxID=2283318 RepID=A0A345PAP8_9GAMM|nr:helix-turn-helix domain-containing protein [Aquirhabdus parva]AXI04357.1 DNA-binding protein [Aquirhabdus parva]AXI04401.1 DNA-binding protein [Aquirhabdus parva]
MSTSGQAAAILQALKNGESITQAEAIPRFSCYRLAARINELRAAGHKIVTQHERINGGSFGRYVLADDSVKAGATNE